MPFLASPSSLNGDGRGVEENFGASHFDGNVDLKKVDPGVEMEEAIVNVAT